MIWNPSCDLFERLCRLPHPESLRGFMQRLLADHGEDVAFVVLFGSMARGDFGRNSDYDVLIGLRQDGERRLIDRLGVFADCSDGRVEPLAYYPREIERMFTRMNGLLLDALHEGLCLHDEGPWAAHRQRFAALIESGDLTRVPRGWNWTKNAYAVAARNLAD